MTANDPTSAVLERLFATIESRRGADPASSYTARLLADGLSAVAKKVGEEAVEVVIAAHTRGTAEVSAESADLLYHLLVLWAATDTAPRDVWAALEKRRGTSGLAEKAARKTQRNEEGSR